MPRKKRGTDTVHFCSNCSNWPTSDYTETSNGDQCNECKAKKAAGNCTAG